MEAAWTDLVAFLVHQARTEKERIITGPFQWLEREKKGRRMLEGKQQQPGKHQKVRCKKFRSTVSFFSVPLPKDRAGEEGDISGFQNVPEVVWNARRETRGSGWHPDAFG